VIQPKAATIWLRPPICSVYPSITQDHTMKLTFDALSLSSTFTSGSNISWSHTVGAGRDAIILVGQSAYTTGGTAASSIAASYNSVGLTSTGLNAGSGIWTGILYLAAPDQGGSYTVQASWSGNSGNPHGRCYAISFHGVDQASPIVTGSLTTYGGATSSPSISVPSVIGSMVLDVLARAETFGGGSSIDAAGSGQTQIMRGAIQLNIKEGYAGSYKATTSSSTTMSWTVTGTQITRISGLCLRPSSRGGSPVISPAMIF